MKIKDLLKKLDENTRDHSHHYIQIYSDGSGTVINAYDKIVMSFDNESQMNQKLTELWNQLNNNEEEWYFG